MAELLHRASPADLEIRSDGRTVVGIVVPFGQVAEIRTQWGSYKERFDRGAFARTIAERGAGRVKFFGEHSHTDGALPVGRAALLREDTAGLYGEFRVSKTRNGDDVLELIRDGALDAFSAGFVPVVDDWNQRHDEVARREVALREVSAVGMPAYEGALIAGLRHDTSALPLADAHQRLVALGLSTRSVSPDDARRRLDALTRGPR